MFVDSMREAGRTVMATVECEKPSALTAEGFGLEVEPHLARLVAQARRLTRDPVAADDLVQDTLERGYRKRALFQPGTDLRAWLLSIMRNVWISTYRRRVAEPSTVSLDGMDEVAVHRNALDASEGSTVETSVVDELGESAILHVIATLPPSFRDVVLLADVHGTPYKTIADELRIPVGSVCSRLSRARQRLRGVLRDEGQDVGDLARAG